MPDTKISGLPAVDTTQPIAETIVIQGGTGKKASVDTQIRREGGLLIAQNGTAAETRAGAIGPSGEAGTAWPNSGPLSRVYRDTAREGATFEIAGTIQFTIRNNPISTNLALGRNNFTAVDGGRAFNIAFGHDSQASNSIGMRNVSVGYQTLTATTSGLSNTAVGSQALAANISGSLNTAVGAQALAANTLGARNTAVGYRAAESQTTATDNTAIGKDALRLSSDPAAIQNTVVGNQSAQLLVGASANNVFVGNGSGATATSATESVSIGDGTATTMLRSTLVGFAGGGSSNRTDQTAIGNSALRGASGAANTAVGRNAGLSVTTGVSNTLVGRQSGFQGTAITTGSFNTMVGHNTGWNTAGQHDGCTFIGRTAGGSSGVVGNADNTLCIGRNAAATQPGSASIGTDNSGGTFWPVALQTNQILLGTPLHTVNSPARVQTQSGTSGTLARVGGTISNSLTATSSPGGSFYGVINTVVIPINTLNTDGAAIRAQYGGRFTNNAPDNARSLRVIFGGGGLITVPSAAYNNTSWHIDTEFVRVSNTLVRSSSRFRSGGTVAPIFVQYTETVGLALATTAYNLELSAQSTNAGTIIMDWSRVEWI